MKAMVIERIGHQGLGYARKYTEDEKLATRETIRRATLLDARGISLSGIPHGRVSIDDCLIGPAPRLPWPCMWMELRCWTGHETVCFGLLMLSARQGYDWVADMIVATDRGRPLAMGLLSFKAPEDLSRAGSSDFMMGKKWDAPSEGAETIFLNGAVRAVYVLRMLNCQNVTTQAVANVVSARTAKHLRSRMGGPMRREVRNIIIAAKGQSGRVISGPGSEYAALPLHMVRGHFKHYTEDRPLFGRLTGWYWWQAHVRGDEKHGKIGHTYELETQDEHATDA